MKTSHPPNKGKGETHMTKPEKEISKTVLWKKVSILAYGSVIREERDVRDVAGPETPGV